MSTNTILRKNNRITIPHEIVSKLHLAVGSVLNATIEDNKTIRFTIVQNVEPEMTATDLYKNFVFEESEEEYDWGLPQGAEIW